VKSDNNRPVSQYSICSPIPKQVPEAYAFAPMSPDLGPTLRNPLKAWK